MNKAKVYEFDPLIYPQKVWIVVSSKDNIDDFEGLEPLEEYDAITQWTTQKSTNKYGIMIRFSSKRIMSVGTMAHESYHATKDILDHVGEKDDVEHQEPFAYLLGWIANCCDKVKNNKIK